MDKLKKHVRVYILDSLDKLNFIQESERIELPEFKMLSQDIPKYLRGLIEIVPANDFTEAWENMESANSPIALITANEIAVRTIQLLVALKICTAEIGRFENIQWVFERLSEKGSFDVRPFKSLMSLSYDLTIERISI